MQLLTATILTAGPLHMDDFTTIAILACVAAPAIAILIKLVDLAMSLFVNNDN